MNNEGYVSLIYNAALLVTLIVTYTLIGLRKSKNTIKEKIISGFIIGCIGIGIMTTAVQTSPGIIFDTKSILVSMTGLFFGFVPTIISVVILSVYRIIQGGIGTLTGVVVIITTACFGLLWHYHWFDRIQKKLLSRIFWLYIFGLIIHIIMLVGMFLLPWEIALDTLKGISLPVLVIFPIVETLVGLVIMEQYDKMKLFFIIQRNEKIIKKSEAALIRSEEKFRLLFEDAPLGYQSLDENGCFIAINMAWLDIFGYLKEEVIGKWFGDFLEPKYVEVFQTNFPLFKNKGSMHVVFEMLKKNKEAVTIDFNGSISYDESGQFKQTHCILQNITELKKAEKIKLLMETRTINQQKLESIGTLAAGVAHEINNPINGIMNYAQLILDMQESNSEISEYSKEIISETEKISEIVKNLLQFSRHDKEEHSYARMEDIINKTMSLIGTVIKSDQITLQKDISQDLPRIKCRSQQIQQVIMNLMTNARDTLNEKYPGYNENKICKVYCVKYNKENREWVRITVEDHGTGIKEDIRDKIFEPFFTTKDRAKGTGLGLSISYGIVKSHNGEISVDTVEGEYTKFHVDLPVNNGWKLYRKEK